MSEEGEEAQANKPPPPPENPDAGAEQDSGDPVVPEDGKETAEEAAEEQQPEPEPEPEPEPGPEGQEPSGDADSTVEDGPLEEGKNDAEGEPSEEQGPDPEKTKVESPEEGKNDAEDEPSEEQGPGPEETKVEGDDDTKSSHQLAKAKRRERYQMATEAHGLSIMTRVVYALPTFATTPVILMLTLFLNDYYEGLGMTLSQLSFYIALARSLDVVSDPGMAYITDSTRKLCGQNWGRRRPYIFAGAPLYAVLLGFLMYPPDAVADNIALYYGLFYISFFLSATLTVIPYDALAPELTDSAEDRDALFAATGLAEVLGSILAIFVPIGMSSYMFDTDKAYKQGHKSCYSDTGIGRDCIKGNFYSKNTYALDTSLGGDDYYNYESLDCIGMDLSKDDDGDASLNYCECVDVCVQRSRLEAKRLGYLCAAIAFGIWFVLSMWNMVLFIKERCQLEDKKVKLPEPPPLVSSMLNVLRNRTFRGLLPAWICDAIGAGILMGMVVYFVRYVVQPEFSGKCTDPTYFEENWQCDSINVTGACFTCLLFAAVAANPLWLFIAKKMGKVRAWIFWSMTSTVTNFLFLTCGHGWFGGMKNEYIWIMFLSALNGIPFGGKFLADSILADTIDYDEFLSGMRCEGVYTMFKGFLPKISAIPAVALPVALLQALGHKSPIDGVVQKQDPIIKIYCLIICGLVTPLFCVAGTIIKMQFPLKEAGQYTSLERGIAQHMLHKESPDPLTGTVYKPFESNPEELHLVFLLDAFPKYETILELEANIDLKADLNLVDKCQGEFIGAVVSAVLLFTGTGLSYYFFMTKDKCSINESDCTDDEARYSSMDDLVPVFLVICFGVSVTVSCFLGLRLGNAKEIVEQGLVFNKDLLNRVKLHRKKLEKMNHLPIDPPLEHPEDYVERRDRHLTPSEVFGKNGDEEAGDSGNGDEEAGDSGDIEGELGVKSSESVETGKSEENSNDEEGEDSEGEGEDSSTFFKSVANNEVGVPEVAAPATPV